MLSLLRRRWKWPTLSPDSLRSKGRILVIDDDPFDYLELFRSSGYNIDQWPDVDDLSALEEGTYDIIVLDIGGVGRSLSTDEGLGVLRQIRRANPAQLIIACSGKTFSLKHKEFFDLADVSLEKSTDYVDFKATIDMLLERRFALTFYVQKIRDLARSHIPDGAKLRAAAERAILGRTTGPLEKYLSTVTIDNDTHHDITRVAEIAISLVGRING